MKTLPLTNSDELVMVDDIDYDYLSKFKWYLNKGVDGISYVITRNRRKDKPFPDIDRLDVRLHRLIFDRYKNMSFYVDHINGNTLDNRRCNLRYATNQQNQANSKLKSNNTSGYKGVTWDKVNNKWVAQIMFNRKYIKLGRFKNKLEAHQAYTNSARELFKEFFRRN